MFAYQDTRVGAATVDVAFTDRHGGVSGGPYASLDLGRHAAESGELETNLARGAAAGGGAAGGARARWGPAGRPSLSFHVEIV